MSRKRLAEPVKARHIEIYESDWDFLEANFGNGSISRVGIGPTIREIVHQKVKWLRAKQIGRLDELGPGEAKVNELIAQQLGLAGAAGAATGASATAATGAAPAPIDDLGF